MGIGDWGLIDSSVRSKLIDLFLIVTQKLENCGFYNITECKIIKDDKLILPCLPSIYFNVIKEIYPEYISYLYSKNESMPSQNIKINQNINPFNPINDSKTTIGELGSLQAFSNTGGFTRYFLTDYKFNPNNNGKKMSNEMYKVLFNLWSEDKEEGYYSPKDFKDALSKANPLFEGIQANDSKDLINFLLERLHQELNNPPGNNQNQNGITNQRDETQVISNFCNGYFGANKSIISNCFYFVEVIQSTCARCRTSLFNCQTKMYLEIPLQEVNNYMRQIGKRINFVNQNGKNPDIDLYECFYYYQKPTSITDSNKIRCNFCGVDTDFYQKTIFCSLPNYLIINLNRGKGGTYKCNVKLYHTLDLSNYVIFPKAGTRMNLYAVICHFGESGMGGHFIAYCKHRINKKWYKYNDAVVTECPDQQNFCEGMPYILFYELQEK